MRRALRELVAWTFSLAQAAARGRSGRKGSIRPSVDRAWARADTVARPAVDFPPEIDFLAGRDVGRDALAQAASTAEPDGVSAEQALLGEGCSTKRIFIAPWRGVCGSLLSRRNPDRSNQSKPIRRSSAARAPAPNRAGLRLVVAPRAAAIRYLLAKAEAGGDCPPTWRSPRRACSTKRSAPWRAHGSPRRRPTGWRVAIRRLVPARSERPPANRGRRLWRGSLRRSSGRSRRARSRPRPSRPFSGGYSPPASSCATWRSRRPMKLRRDPPLENRQLPIYTIVAPLRGEERMVARAGSPARRARLSGIR